MHLNDCQTTINTTFSKALSKDKYEIDTGVSLKFLTFIQMD
ncbi:hypothetical protein DGWBC_1344 [Dehalogenimonas sp. WBC-2]|nr:hypothetical protein DGWBC_1344 [Dehalogenimonas sp. WBC-2]